MSHLAGCLNILEVNTFGIYISLIFFSILREVLFVNSHILLFLTFLEKIVYLKEINIRGD